MRVLWLKSDYVDPPDTGGKLRTYNLLRELCKRCEVVYGSLTSAPQDNGHPVDWASKVHTYFRPEERKSGPAFYARVLCRLFSTRPHIVQKYTSRALQNLQEQYLEASNGGAPGAVRSLMVCDFLEMTGNITWSSPCPKILFQHNVESVIWHRYIDTERNWFKRAYFWFEYQRLARYEPKACNRFDLVLAVSEKDRDTLRALGVTVPIEVIDTGVDNEFFTPNKSIQPTPGNLLFLGSLDWMPNIDGLRWFASEIYPRIRALHPEVTLDIVGRRPVSSILKLPEADNSIRVFDDVPDVRPHIASADIFVVPLRVGSGTRLKIFEAMAMASPVVSTTIGAEGLPVEHGEDILLADSPEAFAEQVVTLLGNPAMKRRIADNGHQLVTLKHSWQAVSKRFYELCQDVCGERN